VYREFAMGNVAYGGDCNSGKYVFVGSYGGGASRFRIVCEAMEVRGDQSVDRELVDTFI
jgi:hypothetical protein